MTQYTYVAGSDAATANALTSITNRRRHVAEFQLQLVRPARQELAGGRRRPVTYSYNVGEVTVTDAAGDASQYFFDENGDAGQDGRSAGQRHVRHLRQQWQPDQPHRPDRPDHDISHTTPMETWSAAPTRSGRPPPTRTPDPTTCSPSVTNAAGQHHHTIQRQRRPDLDRYPNDTVETATYDALGDPCRLPIRTARSRSIHTTPPGRSPA